MNIFSNQDKSFFCNGQKVCVLVEFVNLFSTFGNVYTDVELLKTSIVCCSHKSTYYWVEILPWIDNLSSLNNLFMARFQHNSMSTYVKNKLQMCSVTEHLCRRREKYGNFSQIHTVHSLFVCYKKLFFLTETIYSWHGFNLLGCSLMLRTNYRCFQTLDISVDIAKCVHTLIHDTHFWTVTKTWLVFTEQSIHCKVSTHLDVILCQEQTTDVSSNWTSV